MSSTVADSPEKLDARKTFPVLKTLENGLTNYGEWAIKACSRLQRLDLWRVIDGDASTPPVIPALRSTEVREGVVDEKGNVVPKVTFPGNEEAVKAATEAAGPWQKKNDAALDEIIAVTLSERATVSNI